MGKHAGAFSESRDFGHQEGPMLVTAIVALVISIALFIVGRVMNSRAVFIAGTEKTTVGALESGAKATESGGAKGGFRKFIEINGTVVCDSPLEAELTATKCVHYETKVTREYEENYVSTNSDGSSRSQIRNGTENVSHNSRSCAFILDDGSGRIGVDPSGAEFHLETTLSRFEPGETAPAIGTFVFNNMVTGASGRRTIGYRFDEKCLPVGRKAYVFGEAEDAGGALRIGKSQDGGKRLVISLKSAEQLVHSAKVATLWLTIGAGAVLAASIVIFILAVARR
jgi:hypothetical protein